MCAAGDTLDSIACVEAAMAMLALQPTSAPQQCCWAGISHGGALAELAVPTAPADTLCTISATPSAAAIGIACPDIGMTVSRSPAALVIAESCWLLAGLAHADSPDATERWSMVTEVSRATRRRIMRKELLVRIFRST